MCLGASGPAGGAGPVPRLSFWLRKKRDHLVDRSLDAAGERLEDDDRADRDHGEDDAVLRHRLALLLLPIRPEVLEPLRERQCIRLPSLLSRAPIGALEIEAAGMRGRSSSGAASMVDSRA